MANEEQQNTTETAQKETKSNKTRTIISNVIVLLVVGFGLWWLIRDYFHIGSKTYTEDAQVEEFINPINTRVSAYIKEIKFTEHQKVKKGDTLVVLDDREILTQLGQAEAAYQNALAQKLASNSAVNTVANSVNVVDANIAGAKARLINAEQNLTRYKNLLDEEAATKQQYDQMRMLCEAEKAAYDGLVKQKQTAHLSTTETKTRIGINDAEISRTKAALDMAKINLSYTVIVAPYDGVMGRRLIAEGQLIQPGQQVGTIVLNDQKWVTVNFLESQMPKVKIGKKMMMTADALGGKSFEGVITAISAATGSKYSGVPTDNSTGNFIKVQQRIPVRIEFTDANKKEEVEKLKAGMNLNITLE